MQLFFRPLLRRGRIDHHPKNSVSRLQIFCSLTLYEASPEQQPSAIVVCSHEAAFGEAMHSWENLNCKNVFDL
jgi:hypothetical protein